MIKYLNIMEGVIYGKKYFKIRSLNRAEKIYKNYMNALSLKALTFFYLNNDEKKNEKIIVDGLTYKERKKIYKTSFFQLSQASFLLRKLFKDTTDEVDKLDEIIAVSTGMIIGNYVELIFTNEVSCEIPIILITTKKEVYIFTGKNAKETSTLKSFFKDKYVKERHTHKKIINNILLLDKINNPSTFVFGKYMVAGARIASVLHFVDECVKLIGYENLDQDILDKIKKMRIEVEL